jgi:hypothetical protein
MDYIGNGQFVLTEGDGGDQDGAILSSTGQFLGNQFRYPFNSVSIAYQEGEPIPISDACGYRYSMIAGLGSGSLFPIGQTTISIQAIDPSGNADTCSFNVIIAGDTTAPVLSCPSDVVVPNDPGQCGAVIQDLLAGVFDNCTSPPYDETQTRIYNDNQRTNQFDFTIAPGTNASGPATVTVSVRGDLGSSSEYFSIYDENSNLLGQLGRVGRDCNTTPATGAYSIAIPDINQFVADGTFSITLEATSAVQDFCSFNDMVVRLEIPIQSQRLIVSNDYNANGIDASDLFPVGTTTVTFNAADGQNNAAVPCSFDVTVIDVENPIITCPPPLALGPYACEPASIDLATFIAAGGDTSDNCGLGAGAVLQTVAVRDEVLDQICPSQYTLRRWFEITDANGNSSFPCAADIAIQGDSASPMISLTGPASVSICQGDSYIDLGATAINGCGVDVSSFITITGSVDGMTPGTYPVTYSIIDSCAGTSASVVRNVTVLPPVTAVTILAMDICAGNAIDMAAYFRDFSLRARSVTIYDKHPDDSTAAVLGSVLMARGRARTRAVVSPAQTTTYYFRATAGFGCEQTGTFTIVVNQNCNARIAPIAMLQGAFDQQTSLQRNSLEQQSLIPNQEPYTGLGYSFVGGGGETMNIAPTFSGNIVDWVLVEIRDGQNPAIVLHSRAALLLQDGRIVDTDGISDVSVHVNPQGSYFVAVIHRNHLGVMTNQAINMGTTIDFSDPATQVYGGTGTRIIQQGKALLFAGDADGNGQVQNTDDVLEWAPSAGTAGYRKADYNMDGQVQNTDRVLIWTRNVGRGTAVPR